MVHLNPDNSQNKNIIHVFPNPFNDRLRIVFEKPMSNFTIQLFDLNSRLILEENYNNQVRELEYSLDKLKDAPYFYIVSKGDSIIHSGIVIKQ